MRWKFAAVAGWVVAGVVLMLGADGGQPDRLKLRGLDIVDAKGRVCLSLKEFGGNPMLLMTGVDSESWQIALRVEDGEPSLAFSDPNKVKPRVHLALQKEGPFLSFIDPKTAMVRLTASVLDGDPVVTVLDDKGKPTHGLMPLIPLAPLAPLTGKP